MRKFIAIAAALGFLATTSLTPVFAASQTDFGSTSTDLSAAKKKAGTKKAGKKAKKSAKKGKKKVGALAAQDFSAAKKAKKGKKPAKKGKKKAGKKVADNVIVYRVAA